MWGVIPAAGAGSRIQPLAFSKELLPIGSRLDGSVERPCAVCEYLLDRMIAAGVDKVCFIIGPGKSDIIEYFGGRYGSTPLAYVVQQEPLGLCNALFCAAPLIAPKEALLIGLPDKVWMPRLGFSTLPEAALSLLLFPVERPDLFDSVVVAEDGSVRRIDVKSHLAVSSWIWGGIRMDGSQLHELGILWHDRAQADEFLGTLINAWIGRGGRVMGVKAGTHYVDVGTFQGYRSAIALLNGGPGAMSETMVQSPPATLLHTYRVLNR